MKKFLILLLAVAVLSGCVEQKAVKSGDNISVDYTGRTAEDGKVFDTSIESVAKENNITKPEYKHFNFTVGKGQVIKGFDEGVIGMKVGDTKNLRIPPEMGYGPVDPKLIRTIPIIEDVPATTSIPKVLEMPVSQFESIFGTDHKKGDIVKTPQMNFNLTVLNITSNATASNVTLSYNLKVGDRIISRQAPWNETVIKVDEKNITIKHEIKKLDTIQFYQGAPWNTTVLDVTNESITLRHNAIPDMVIPGMFGRTKVSFNETSIIIDNNNALAGKTLIFDVTLRSIDK